MRYNLLIKYHEQQSHINTLNRHVFNILYIQVIFNEFGRYIFDNNIGLKHETTKIILNSLSPIKGCITYWNTSYMLLLIRYARSMR